jgi:xylan 1,4-beta-xylosidase
LKILRKPLGEEIINLRKRSGFLRLYGRASKKPSYSSIVARRWQSFTFSEENYVEFEPEDYQPAWYAYMILKIILI